MLTRHFLQRSARQLGVEPKRISDAALQVLQHFAYPGNVRQLENICHWLTVMAPAQVIAARDLPPEVYAASLAEPSTAGDRDWEQALEGEAQRLLEDGRTDVWDRLTRRFESSLIRTALAATQGRRVDAALRLGIGRNTITRKIQELGLDDESV